MVCFPDVGSIQLLAVSAFTVFSSTLLPPPPSSLQLEFVPKLSLLLQTTILTYTQSFLRLFLIEKIFCHRNLGGRIDGLRKERKELVEADILNTVHWRRAKFEFQE